MFFKTTPSISVAEAAKLTKGPGAAFIDVRSPAEYASGHAKGAQNVPLQDIRNAVERLRSYDAVYVICQSGGRSSAAVSLLRSAKIPAINVAGGTSAWHMAGLPLQ